MGLEIALAFKEAQIVLLEQSKKVTSFEFCSSLKESFSHQKQPPSMTFGTHLGVSPSVPAKGLQTMDPPQSRPLESASSFMSQNQ